MTLGYRHLFLSEEVLFQVLLPFKDFVTFGFSCVLFWHENNAHIF